MSLKDLANNIQKESEFHTFVKSERVIRRPLSLHHLHKDMADIIRSHKHEEARKSNVKAWMTNWFLHGQYESVNEVCNQAIDIVKSVTKNDQKGQLEKFFTFDCWGAIYKEGDYTIMHNHWPHLWSFVYYVNCPDGSAPLLFDRCIHPGKGIERVVPRTGLMVMFPGWVNHSVPKHIGEDRIVVAGNLTMNPFSHIKTLEGRGLGQWRSVYGSRGNTQRL